MSPKDPVTGKRKRTGGGPPPLGNTNATKNRPWREALGRALLQYADDEIKAGHALRAIADGVVRRALKGDPDAVSEIANRLDGKPAQAVELTGADGGAIATVVTVNFVSPAQS